MNKASRAALVWTHAKKHSQNRVGLLTAGFNLALLAACGPALAHGSNGAAGHTGFAGQAHQLGQSWSGAASHFDPTASQTVIHPHAFVSPAAATLPIASSGSNNFAPQHAVHSFAGQHNYETQQAFVRPTFIQVPTGPSSNTSASEQTIQLDLTSSTASVVLQPGMLTHSSSVTINLGGASTTFQAGDKVTPAELVAIYQSQGYGGQKIVVDSQGRAEGGSFSLNNVLSANHPVQISGIVVPQGVTAFDYVNSKSNISVGGDLLNYGSIIDITRGVASANLSAVNIINESSGSISTVGHGAHTGVVNLSLNASNDFTNLGSITSSGSLSISAGGILTNGSTAGGASSVTTRPTISAVGDVNLQAAHIINSGLVSSSAGNVTLGAPTGYDLNVNNTGGTISALTGAINVRDAGYAGISNSTVTGGDLLSKQLNLHAGGGMIDVNVDQLTGAVVSDGLGVHVAANTDTLTIGSQCLTGDPTYFNTGNILLNGDITATEAITILAGGNITANSGLTKIEAIDGKGQGYNITIIAGVPNLSGSGTTTTVPGSSASTAVTFSTPSQSTPGVGGKVDLTGSQNGLQINSRSTGANLSGGNIAIGAYGNGVADSGAVLLKTNSIIDAGGNGTGKAGSVGIFSGSITKGGQLAIQLGTIAAASSVTAVVMAPDTPGNNWSFATNGSGSSVVPSFNYNVGSGYGKILINGNINATGIVTVIGGKDSADTLDMFGSITSTNGSAILASTGTVTTYQNITAPAGITVISGGDYLTGNSAKTLSTASATGNAGNITLLAGQSFNYDSVQINVTNSATSVGGEVALSGVDTINTTSSALGGSGGNILIGARTGSGTFSGDIGLGGVAVTTGGNGSGSNGNVTIYGNAPTTGLNPFPFVAGSSNIWDISGGSSSGNVDLRSTNFNTSGTFNITISTGKLIGSLLPTSLSTGTVQLPFLLKMGGGDLTLGTASTYIVGFPTFQGGINNLNITGSKVDVPGISGFSVNNLSVTSLGGAVNVLSDIKVNNNITLQASGATSSITTGTALLQTNTGSITMVSDGDISIGNSNVQAGVVSTGNITMVAAGKISTSASGGKIVTDSSGTAGNINIVAGVDFTFDGISTITFNFGSSTGGTIDFATNALNAISASSSTAGDAGNITFAAFQGSTNNSGQIILPGALTVQATTPIGNGGTITAVGQSGIGDFAHFFSANTAGSSTTNSNITLSASTPSTNGVSLDTSTGALSGTFLGNSINDVGVYTDNLNAGNRITITGGYAQLGTLAKAQQVVVAANNIFLSGDIKTVVTDASILGGIILISETNIDSAGATNLVTDSGVIGAPSGSITLVSGADFIVNPSIITILGPSNLSGTTSINIVGTKLSTKNTIGGAAGNFTAVAYTKPGSESTSGLISLFAGSLNTSGKGGTNGDIQIVAGSSSNNSIQLGQGITIFGGTVGTGNVLISGSTPQNVIGITTTNGSFGHASGTFAGGAITGGDLIGSTFAIAVQGGRIDIHQAQPATITASKFFGAGNILVESLGDINLQTGLNANNVVLVSGNDINMNNAGAGFTVTNGLLLVASRDILSTTNQIAISAGNGGGNSGTLSMFAGASYAVTVSASGDNIAINGPSVGGGNINLSQLITLSTQSGNGNGGDMTLVAYSDSAGARGQITLDPTLTALTGGTNGSNGNFTAVAGGQNTTAISIGKIDTTFNGTNAAAATITLQAAAPAIGPFNYDQTGAKTGGGSVLNITPTANLTNSNVASGDLTTIGGTIDVFASKNVQLGNLTTAAPALANLKAGNITVTAYGTDDLFIGVTPGAGKTNYTGTLTATGAGNNANGDISVSNLDPGDLGSRGITLFGLAGAAIANSGNVGGGSLSLVTGQSSKGTGDVIALAANDTLNYSASSNPGKSGDAGTITLKGYDVTWTGKGTGTKLTLNVDASAIGNAGKIDYQTASNNALKIDSTNSPFNFSAAGSSIDPSHGTGGSISIQNGGSITFDPTSNLLNVSSGVTGSGGSLALKAGYFNDLEQNQTSNLLVTGSLNADGKNGGSGGNFTLYATSPTVFNLGQTTGNTNGVQGTISVAGSGSGPFNAGSITVHAGGGITTSYALTNVDEVFLRGSGTGSITLGGAIGTAGKSSTVFLAVDKGSILQPNKAFVVSGGDVILQTGTTGKAGSGFSVGTSKAAFVVNAAGLRVVADDTVNISSVGTAPLVLNGFNQAQNGSFTIISKTGAINSTDPGLTILSGQNLTLTAPSMSLTGTIGAANTGASAIFTATSGDFQMTGSIAAANITISAAKGSAGLGTTTGQPISVNNLTVTALNNITASGQISVNDSITLKTTSTKAGGIDLDDKLIAFTASTSTIVATAAFGDIQITGDVGAGKSVTLTATKGALSLDGGVGGKNAPTTIVLTALDRVTVGTHSKLIGINAGTSIIIKTTDAKNGFIELNGDIKTTNLTPSTGVISITSKGDIEMFDLSKVIEATKSVTVTSGTGHIFVGAVGNKVQGTDTVTITAARDIEVGNIKAINTVALKTTTTNGDITADGNIIASSATKGVVTITSLESVDLSNGDTSAGKSVTVTGGGGNTVSIATMGANLATGAISITSTGQIKATGEVKAVNSITATSKTTSTAADAGKLFFDNGITTTAPTGGKVTLTSSGAGTGVLVSTGTTIAASGSVAISATKGGVSVGTTGLIGSAPATIAITALTGISTGGDLTASKSVTLKTTSTKAGDGDINIFGDILAFSQTGTVSVTSSSTTTPGIVVNSTNDISGCASVTLTAAKAAIDTGSVGGTLAKPHVTAKATLTALNNITNDGTITVQSALVETATGTGALIKANANLRAEPLSSPFTSGTVALTAANGIIDTSPADVTAGKSVTMTAATKGTGAITVGTIGSTDAAGTFVAKALHTFANTGAINTVGPVTITTAASSLPADGVDLAGNITTSAGGISVTSGGTFLKVEPSVALSATGSSKVKAPILLLDSNKTVASITFGNLSSVTTGGAGGFNITVAIGTAPTKGTNNVNPNPGGITETKSGGGDIFYGPAGVVDPTSTGNITAKGANVIFSAPATLTNSIKFTGTTFFADPPEVAGTGPAIHLVNSGAAALNQIVAPTVVTSPTIQNTALSLVQPTVSNQITIADMMNTVSQRTLSGQAAFNAYTDLQNQNDQQYKWISATEIDGGEIPVSLLSDAELAISGANVAQLQHAAQKAGTQHKVSHLTRGSVLSIAGKDRKITTAFGEVSIAANSMVLVMAMDHGMAVYNFDDTHANAVTVTAGGQTISVRPGTSTMITPHHVKSFEQVNPAQLVFYRRLVERNLDGNVKAFHSEFSVHSAMRAVKPLRDILLAKDKETSRVANHFLKTTAILMQMQGGSENFKQIMKPRLTASAI